jgi:hypothetical protein
MVERIDRRFGRGEGEHYMREEVYFPTLAAHLSPGTPAKPLIYIDAFCEGPAVSPAVIFGLIDGTLRTAPTTRRRCTGSSASSAVCTTPTASASGP